MPQFTTVIRMVRSAAVCCAFAAGALAGQSTSPMLDPEQARQDFDVLHRALQEAHGGYTRFVGGPELERRLAAHRARLDRPVRHHELAGILSEAIAELRDGHARLELDSVTIASLAAAQLFPLRVSLEQDRLVVRLNDSPTNRTIAPGMEIVSVNGRTSAEIVAALLPKVSGDGFIETGRRYRLSQDFSRLHWLYIEQTGRFAILARDSTGQQASVTIDGVLDRDRRTVSNPVNANVEASSAALNGLPGRVSLEFVGENDVALLRVRAFDGQTFVATLDSVFREVRKRGTSSMILDLRGNGGGVDEYGARLVSYFSDKPFRYFDRIRVSTIAPSFATWLPRTFDAMKSGTVPNAADGFLVTAALHSGVGEQPPAPPHFAGKLVVLIDGGSFSTTADVAAHLRSSNRAVFVGEETAGTYEGNTSGLNALIVLPNSGLRLKVMMYGYWNAVTPVVGGRGVMPEHNAPFRVADLIAGRDPARERAIALVNQRE